MRKGLSALLACLAMSSLMPLWARTDYMDLFRNGSYESIRKAVRGNPGIVLKKTGPNKQTALMHALESGRSGDILGLIIDAGPGIDRKAKDGRTAVMFAAQYAPDAAVFDRIVRAESILKSRRKKRILRTDKQGHDSFHYARLNRNPAVYDALLAYTDDPAPQPPAEQEAQEVQAQVLAEEAPALQDTGQPETEECTADAMPEPPPAEEPKEFPAPPEAYKKTYLFDTDIYMEATAAAWQPQHGDVSAAPHEAGLTPLMAAAKASDARLVRQLMQSGAHPDDQDSDGWTALMYAARYAADEEAVSALISGNASMEIRNAFGLSALDLAIQYNPNVRITQILLRDHAPDTGSAISAFYHAIETPVRPAEKTLAFIQMGQSVGIMRGSDTPLMHAAKYAADSAVLGVLIDAGANIHTRDASGRTAFDYAKENGRLIRDESFWRLNGGS